MIEFNKFYERYNYQIDEMMKTPLSEPCIYGKAYYNDPNLMISYFESGQYFAIYSTKLGVSSFRWTFSGYNFRGMEITDANFNVRDFMKLFASILIL